MVIKEKTYTTFNGEEVKEKFHFNLKKSEYFELDSKYPGGLKVFLDKAIKTKDVTTLSLFFKDVLLMAYGEKSEDGRRFKKSQEIKDEFYESAAFDAIFDELTKSEEAMGAFIDGLTADLT